MSYLSDFVVPYYSQCLILVLQYILRMQSRSYTRGTKSNIGYTRAPKICFFKFRDSAVYPMYTFDSLVYDDQKYDFSQFCSPRIYPVFDIRPVVYSISHVHKIYQQTEIEHRIYQGIIKSVYRPSKSPISQIFLSPSIFYV